MHIFKSKIVICVIVICWFAFVRAGWADTLEDIQMEADYILACQYMIPGPGYGAINNIYGDPDYIVPRENGMAVLGLIMASEALGNVSYRDRAELAADYLVGVQDTSDGAWYDQYNYDQVAVWSKSPTQTAEVMIAFYKLGYTAERYGSMKMGAEFLLECQKVENKTGNDDGLICGGKDDAGNYRTWRWTSDNSYAYQALRAAQAWARIKGENEFASRCAQAAEDIIDGINSYLYEGPVWHIVIDAGGAPQGNPDLDPPYNNLPSWIKYAPQMLDLPADGVDSLAVGEWIYNAFQQQGDGSCIGYVMEGGALHIRKYPGLSFQAAFCWYDLGQDSYADNAWNWAANSGLWQATPDINGITGGWIDWVEISPDPATTPDEWWRFIDTSFYAIATLSRGYDFNIYNPSELEQQLYQTALPYIRYFKDRALGDTPDPNDPDGFIFEGLTRSFQLYLGGHTPEDEAFILHGASAYDQTILGRICLADGTTTILDTYVDYFNQIDDPSNPLINANGDYYDGSGDPLLYGPYRIIRISGRDITDWWETWDWIVDTGAAATLILYATDAYQQTLNLDYRNLAILFAGYILRLQDVDGGIRYGPRGMWHPEDPINYYWYLKSTEQNERVLYALEALYEITSDVQYSNAATQIRDWLKDMYDASVHLYHSASAFNEGTQLWEKADFGYVATDVMALAPLEMMFQDSYFGAIQQDRDDEVDAMFAAIEERTAFFDNESNPVFFRFSISQVPDPVKGDYGSVEMSSQMALAYLRAAQNYAARGEDVKVQEYLSKYNTLVSSLENFFMLPDPVGEPDAKVAPYASYFDNRSVAGGLPTGTGYDTYNCQAALASAYYAFAKAGYDPTKLGGGVGIPQTSYTLNMSDLPWYENLAPYSSTGAATAQMILNYIRDGAGEPLLSQDEIYEYAKDPDPYGPELTPDEVDKALGHFDPYDSLVSNSYDIYDGLPGGNPYQGYNFTVDTYDPDSNPEAINEYMRDICHWMAYLVQQEYGGVPGGALVARPNTPAAIPLYGTYEHWVVVKGYAASENPSPDPSDPWYTPDFTVYGFWIKDPRTDGIGRDTYKTAAECELTYFAPLATGDSYDGMFLQVAEPPAVMSHARVEISQPVEALANPEFIRQQSVIAGEPENKRSWRDIVDPYLLSDPEAIAAFDGTEKGESILVRRPDRDDSDYYLLPFGRYDKEGDFLATGVIILDAEDGYFKEAGWTETPEKFLKVDRKKALQLVRKSIIKEASNYIEDKKLLRYIKKAKLKLLWQPNSYSSSPYKPYWRVELGGRIWYVTQDAEVFCVNSGKQKRGGMEGEV